MNVLLIADGRSPITRRWANSLLALGHQVTLVTTFPCAPLPGIDADICLPVAFSAFSGSGAGRGAGVSTSPSSLRRAVASFRTVFLAGRYRLGPLTLAYYGPRLKWLVERIKPDLIHALRIPFEGMLASYIPPGVPLAVSIWGNDLTLHARGSSAMANLTRRTLARADALHADAARDIRLAQAWGFSAEKPTLVVPGSGGLDLAELDAARSRPVDPDLFLPDIVRAVSAQHVPGTKSPSSRKSAASKPDLCTVPLVINPRGFRTGSVRQDTFFQAIPLVLERHPDVRFASAAMAGQREALQWVERLKLEGKVTLLPHLSQPDLWALFARAAVSLSISQHDGTPNSLLEAMALGAFPIAGDIESIREWIIPGANGLLVEPSSPQSLAEAILLALDNPALRRRAAECNAQIIRERAEIGVVREKVGTFYSGLVKK